VKRLRRRPPAAVVVLGFFLAGMRAGVLRERAAWRQELGPFESQLR